jgi:hypothetical protein
MSSGICSPDISTSADLQHVTQGGLPKKEREGDQMAITSQERSVIASIVITFLALFMTVPAHAVKVGGAISISAVYTTDGANTTKAVFSSGDSINYHVDVYNNSGMEIPVDIRFYVFPNSWDPSLYGFDSTVHVDKMPLGLSRFYTPTSLPGYSKPFYYFLRISVTPSKSVLLPDDTGDEVDGNFTIESPKPMARTPEGKAPNLIVLVHGCCQHPDDIKEWDGLGNKIYQEIPDAERKDWEVVVKDWLSDTPITGELIEGVDKNLWNDALTAYNNAMNQGHNLAKLIEVNKTTSQPNKYKYVHLIGHSAGANLIDIAGKDLASYYGQSSAAPFIHLTFLDAFTLSDFDAASYGFLPRYLNYQHFSEHYVDKGFPSTDACLASAFNFDITLWTPSNKEPGGHQWPRHWYDQSVTNSAESRYGYHLSAEGGDHEFSGLAAEYPSGTQCPLNGKDTVCKPAACWK